MDKCPGCDNELIPEFDVSERCWTCGNCDEYEISVDRPEWVDSRMYNERIGCHVGECQGVVFVYTWGEIYDAERAHVKECTGDG